MLIQGGVLISSGVSMIGIPSQIDILLVAGGAGGTRSFNGGSPGGGAGGWIEVFNIDLVSGTTYNITIGSGGNGGGYSTSNNGNDSLFGTLLTAKGGGANILNGFWSENGRSGGSGGGSAPGSTWVGGSVTQPLQPGLSGAYGFGNRGASVVVSNGDVGGGGGGAGGPGGSVTTVADGGAGKQSSISGTPTFYAGGGGGASYGTAGTPPQRAGAGGSGIGGDGSNLNGAAAAVGGSGSINGLLNSGSGGGGAYGFTSGNGGSGVCILRHPNTIPQKTTTGSPTITTSSGYIIYIWTGTGSITW